MLNHKILIVEDDVRLAEMVAEFLQTEQFETFIAYSSEEAVLLLEKHTFNLVILDLSLPQSDGMTFYKTHLMLMSLPVIILTATNDDLVEVTAINNGVDDYLSKPVRPQVLVARIKSVLRKSNQSPALTDSSNEGLFLDTTNFTVTLDGEAIPITDSEFELLDILYHRPGEIISRDELFKIIKGYQYDGLDRVIDMRISSLRKRLNDEQPPHRFIKTIRSRGYLFIKE